MNTITGKNLGTRSFAWVAPLALIPRLLVAGPDVALQTTVDPAVPTTGQLVQFTITASNVGADAATSVQVKDKLPAKFTSPTGMADGSSTIRAKRDPVDLQSIDLRSPSIAIPMTQAAPVKPLRLTLTQAELQKIISRYQANQSYAVNGQLEEILVIAPAELLPMRDITQEVWGGLAAPLWALLHPAEAWRIFLPISPK